MLSAAMGIAVSGMDAGTRRVAASASNVANVRTDGAPADAAGKVAAGAKEAYRPIGVAQTDLRTGTEPSGVRASYVPISPPWSPAYQPDSPNADADGLVSMPNVDLAAETVGQIQASRAYAANVSAVRTADDMLREALDMKA